MSEMMSKKYMNIPMGRELYSRANCQEMAKEIAGEEKITGMSLS